MFVLYHVCLTFYIALVHSCKQQSILSLSLSLCLRSFDFPIGGESYRRNDQSKISRNHPVKLAQLLLVIALGLSGQSFIRPIAICPFASYEEGK